jgi:hypothetical protein
MPLSTRTNWWFYIKQQIDEENIENIHLCLCLNTKTIDPTKRHFDTNAAEGIIYAIMVIYYKQIKGNKKGAFMKVSFH